jgi:5'-nucleotidase
VLPTVSVARSGTVLYTNAMVQNTHKKILYVDMDNVLVDFQSAFSHMDPVVLAQYEGHLDDVPGIFAHMLPMSGAIEAYTHLSTVFDTYILSTSPWANPTAWKDKVEWVQRYLGEVAHKRLILTHHKHLNRGDFLVDDRTKNGADRFEGEHILFGSAEFPDWPSVVAYLEDRAGMQ